MKLAVPVIKRIYGSIIIDIPDEEWEAKETARKKKTLAQKVAEQHLDDVEWFEFDDEDVDVSFGYYELERN